MVPWLAITAKTLKDLPKAISKLCCISYCSFYLTVILLFSIVKVRPVNIHQFACPSYADIIFHAYLACKLFLYLGL
jgi:hypothetical protein